MAIFDFDWFGGGAPAAPATIPNPAQYYADARRQAGQMAGLQFGLGLLAAGGPSREPVGIGSAIGRAGIPATAGYQHGLTNALHGSVNTAQLQKMQNDLAADEAWRQQWGLAPSGAGAQVPSSGAAVTQALTPQPGQRPGPTPQAATAMLGAVTPTETGTGYTAPNIPAHLRSYIGGMGRAQGSQFLAGLAAKDMERGIWTQQDRNGIPGQVNRLSGEWKPLDPTLSKVTVNPSMSLPPQESEFEKTVGKNFGENYNNLQNAGMTVGSRMGKLDRLESLLSKPYTGLGAEQVQQGNRLLKAAGDAFGIDTSGVTEKVGSAEAATALANEIALEFRNPSGGAGMPGAMSDQDREFLKQMTGANLTTTPEGRKLVIETRRRMIQRDAEIAKLARDYYKEKGKFDSGFYDRLQDFSDKNPLFKGLEAPKAQTVPPPPAGFTIVP